VERPLFSDGILDPEKEDDESLTCVQTLNEGDKVKREDLTQKNKICDFSKRSEKFSDVESTPSPDQPQQQPLPQQQQKKRGNNFPTFGSVKHFVSSKQQQQKQQQQQHRDISDINCELTLGKMKVKELSSYDHNNLSRRLFFNRSIDIELRS